MSTILIRNAERAEASKLRGELHEVRLYNLQDYLESEGWHVWLGTAPTEQVDRFVDIKRVGDGEPSDLGAGEVYVLDWTDIDALDEHMPHVPTRLEVPPADWSRIASHIKRGRVVPLETLGAGDQAEFGSKAANLGEASRISTVPSGIAISSDVFREYLAHYRVDLEALDAVQGVSVAYFPKALRKAERAMDIVLDTVNSNPIPPDIWSRISYELARLQPARSGLAVRSSCSIEDLLESSFAGQYATTLAAQTDEDIERAILDCWASQYHRRVREYAVSRLGTPVASPAMGVVIQHMIDPDFAGVCFTQGPTQATAGNVVIEAVPGLADALVGGEVTPWHFQLDRSGRPVKEIDPGNELASPPSEVVKNVLDVCTELEKHFGSPQDVEWAYASGQVFVLQSRAITTIPPAGGRPLGPAPRPVGLADIVAPGTDMVPLRGASGLLSRQRQDGSWEMPGLHEWTDVATARAVLLLLGEPFSRDAIWQLPQGEQWIEAGLGSATRYLSRSFDRSAPPGTDSWDRVILLRALNKAGLLNATSPAWAQYIELKERSLAGFQEAATTEEWFGAGLFGATIELFLEMGDLEAARACADLLIGLQGRDGSFESLGLKGTAPEEWHTSQAVSALFRAAGMTGNQGYKNAADIGADWIQSRQNDDGSWGSVDTPYSSFNAYFTSFALMALLDANRVESRELRRGEAWLRTQQLSSGAFSDTAVTLMAMEYFQKRYGSVLTVSVSLPLLNQILLERQWSRE